MKKYHKTKAFIKKELSKGVHLHNVLIPVLGFLVICSLATLAFTTASTGDLIVGDVNGDYKVDRLDATLINNHAIGRSMLSSAALKVADLNLNGIAGDRQDACMILREKNIPTKNIPVKCKNIFAVGYDRSTNLKNLKSTKTSTKKNNINSVKVASSINIGGYQLGDVNKSKNINSVDALLVQKYLFGLSALNKDQLTLADVDQDSKITYRDSILITSYFGGKISELPYKGTQYPLEKYGDVTLEGAINSVDAMTIAKHVSGLVLMSTQSPGYCMADVDLDAKITIKDSQNVINYFTNFINKLPYTDDTVLGDVNLDGSVNATDSLMINRCSTNSSLSYKQWLAADVDQDGIVGSKDAYFITKSFVDKKFLLPVKGDNLIIPAGAQLQNSLECKRNNGKCSRFVANIVGDSAMKK